MDEELESQVAKIQIGGTKSAQSYVHVVAEKAPSGSSELYAVLELPLLHPAAQPDCERICLAVAGSLRRSYKKQSAEGAFEAAIAEVNEELGKLIELGQATWSGKLSGILAVKDGPRFHISTCGRVTALLLREGVISDVSCSGSQKPSPLRTFENVASGDLVLGDVLVLSTTQLLNYLSVDRLKVMLGPGNLLGAAQDIVQLLKETAGPEVAFGTILNMQVEVGATPTEAVDLENREPGPSLLTRAGTFVTGAFDSLRSGTMPKMPKLGMPGLLSIRKAPKVAEAAAVSAWSGIKQTKDHSLETVRGFSTQKKILAISVVVLAVAFSLNLIATKHFKKIATEREALGVQLAEAQTLVQAAENSLLYKNEADARTNTEKAAAKIPPDNELSPEQQKIAQSIRASISQLQDRFDRKATVAVENLGSLGQGPLLNLGKYIAVQSGNSIISFDREAGTVQDGALASSKLINATVLIKGTVAVTYDGSNFTGWDYAKKQFGKAFNASVPSKDQFVNMKYYPTNSRVYTINKTTNQLTSFAVSGLEVSKPVVASKPGMELSGAIDFAIDGSVYVLTKTGVLKYTAGKIVEYNQPEFPGGLSADSKIVTDSTYKYVYILDPGHNRVTVLGKDGTLVGNITAREFSNLKDMVVDEPGKLIYLLSGTSLLKVPYSL